MPLYPKPNWDETKLMQAGRLKFVFAGNVGESQDIEGVIDAFSQMKKTIDAHFYIIGSGRNLENVKKHVRNKGLEEKITFLGRYPEERMPYFFANADALIVALKNNDIFSLTVPYKVQCYMACGRPIIGMLSGEGARIIQNSNSGFVAPAGQSEDLAKALEQFCSLGPSEREKFGQNARDFFNTNYAKESVFGTLEAALTEDSHIF